MKRILFVDDEPKVLDSLQRMLYPMRGAWEMSFVGSGREALGLLSESAYDVLITDVRMPAMSGVELLSEVVKQHPQLLRMVLSGTMDQEITLRAVALAHQYLVKPCNPETLRATVEEALKNRVILQNPAFIVKLLGALREPIKADVARGFVALGLFGFANFTAQLNADQPVANTTLAVRVEPEAHLNRSEIGIRFVVSADGATDIITQSSDVIAWARAAPAMQIRLTARVAEVMGPAGPADAEIRWSGSLTRASAGGQSASCTKGSLASHVPQDLLSGWQHSGSLTCALRFELANARDLPPGTYTAVVNLDLRVQ